MESGPKHQPAKAEGGPGKEYYEHYARRNLFDIAGLLADTRDSPNLLKDIATHPQLHIGLLGSATPLNMINISGWLTSIGRKDLTKDQLCVIDKSEIAIEKHKNHLDQEGFPEGLGVDLVQGDITAMPFASGSLEIVIADYTGNFISEKEKLELFFKEAHRVMSHTSVFFLRYSYSLNFLRTTARTVDLVHTVDSVDIPSVLPAQESIGEYYLFPHHVWCTAMKKAGFALEGSIMGKGELNTGTLLFSADQSRKLFKAEEQE